MTRQEHRQALLDIAANGRLLLATATNDDILTFAERIKKDSSRIAAELGFSIPKFESDSIVKYKVLLEKIS